MGHCTFKRMAERLADLGGRFTHAIAVQPTGWSFGGRGAVAGAAGAGQRRRGGGGASVGGGLLSKRTSQRGRLTIYSCPYSEHSSFEELRACVRMLRPRTIVPTVNCSTRAKVAEQLALLTAQEDTAPEP